MYVLSDYFVSHGITIYYYLTKSSTTKKGEKYRNIAMLLSLQGIYIRYYVLS